MSDLRITNSGNNAWDIIIGSNGDIEMETDDINLVVQRVTHRLMTWLRESPYDRSAGIPYVDGVFGLEPVEAMVFVLTQEILDTDGVDALVEPPTYTLGDDRTLSISAEIRVSGDTAPVTLTIAAL